MQAFIETLTGQWAGGTKTLYTPWLEVKEHVSDCPLTWRTVLNETALALSYTWQHEGKNHQGEMLFMQDPKTKQFSAAWADSWHQHAFPMLLTGTADAQGVPDMLGTFPAPPDPDWGWRIRVFGVQNDTCRLEMYVIPPAGQGREAIAVRIEARQSG